jgi:uncharacterized coiled-coil protein SlyX
MKTMTLDTLWSFNRILRNPMNRAPSPRRSFIILPVLACFAFLPGAHAQLSPPPDGCYPNFTTAEGCNALQSLSTGAGNTGLGWYSLFSNTDASFNTGVGGGALALNNGDSNTAVGAAALLLNTTGHQNTAVGTDALVYNDTGFEDTAVGAFALFGNTIGTQNTAIGNQALSSNTTAFDNTACGFMALLNNVDGLSNTAVGAGALRDNVSGSDNQALGRGALRHTEGSGNIGIGREAGVNETTVDDVICIGSPGDTNGGENTSNRCYIGQIVGVTTGGPGPTVAVMIDQDGQLGTVVSSRRFKKDIEPMDQSSEAILKLKPVTFHYKNRDKKQDLTPEFGLIAEDVEQVNRDLVAYGKDGKPFTVRYDAVNVMLLNEFLKEYKKVEEQQKNITQLNSKLANQAAIIAQQQKGMEALTAQLKEQAAQIQKVSAQLNVSKSGAQVASYQQ